MFIERLQEISNRVEGALALVLVAQDGMPVESVTSKELDLEALSAELMTQVRAISQNHQELSVGIVRHLSVRTDQLIMMVSALSQEYYLLLVLEAGANAGRARFELRRARLLFENDI